MKKIGLDPFTTRAPGFSRRGPSDVLPRPHCFSPVRHVRQLRHGRPAGNHRATSDELWGKLWPAACVQMRATLPHKRGEREGFEKLALRAISALVP